MSDLKRRINDDMKTALKAREKERLGTIRLVLAAIKQREVDERTMLDDSGVLAVLDKMVKQRRDSIAQYGEAGRQDLVDKEQAELALIQAYMPAPLAEHELAELVDAAIASSGAGSLKDMGKVMGVLKPKVQGRADMGQVSALVKQRLG
jgi:uncharacterized protein YqeY